MPSDPTDIRIEQLSEKHYEDLMELWKECGLPLKPKGRDSRQEFARQLELSSVLFCGLFCGDNLTGTVLATHDGRKGWINRLAVHADFQRKGYGASLIKKAEDWLKNQGIGIFACLIEPGHESSTMAFEKAGYRLFDGVTYHTKRLDPDI